MLRLYNVENKYFYEVLDDYKTSTNKKEILACFFKEIWDTNRDRVVYEKHVDFKVDSELLSYEIGQIFQVYNHIPYLYCKSSTIKKDYINLLRQKINNLYTYMCDGTVCITKEYMGYISTPKRLYYRWKNGNETWNCDDLMQIISKSSIDALECKERERKKKMKIGFNEYKCLIASFVEKIFERYISLEDYENKNILTLDIDLWTEDNFAIKYFCKSLNGYIKNYQKEYFGVKRNKEYKICNCGGLIQKDTGQLKCNRCRVVYNPMKRKVIKCVDCGVDFEVDSKANNRSRCNMCAKKERRKINHQNYINRKLN